MCAVPKKNGKQPPSIQLQQTLAGVNIIYVTIYVKESRKHFFLLQNICNDLSLANKHRPNLDLYSS